MKIIVKGSFDRDLDVISERELNMALAEKISQIKIARNIDHVTGFKILKGYTNHGRIVVNTARLRYRMGVILRGDTIWLVRFLARKVVYRIFP